jgi:hypothetical protein
MNHLYLFTLEIEPLEIGRTYDKLPSHLTLMSRFLSDLAPRELSEVIRPTLEAGNSIELAFGPTIELGPKKVTAHMINSPDEQRLHEDILMLLEKTKAIFQYPQFIGVKHKPHVTQRAGVDFPPKSRLISSVVYLIEIVDGQRVIRSKFHTLA